MTVRPEATVMFAEAAEASHTQRLVEAALTGVRAFEQLPKKAAVS